jgi:nicotinamidase/pyrazinamidase
VRKHQQVVVQKQSLDLFTNPSVGKLIRVLPPHAFVFGVTTEYCVKFAALGLRKSGVKTVVISDAIAALGPESGANAVEEMRRAGVDFITTETLMGVLSA